MRKNQEGPYVAVGKILSPWGLRGESKFELYYPESEVLFETRQVYLKAGFSFRKVSLLSARRQGKSLRIHLEGMNSPEEAKTLQGEEVYVEVLELPPAGKEEFYAFELVGLEVVTSSGVTLGKAAGVVHYGASDILVVSDFKGKEIQIPLVPDFLRGISLEEKKIVVEGIEDFL